MSSSAASGADTIYGDSRLRHGELRQFQSGVTVSLLSGNGTGGTAEGDKLYSIEGLVGSARMTTFWSATTSPTSLPVCQATTTSRAAAATTLFGGADNDVLKGGGGEDKLHGQLRHRYRSLQPVR